MTAKTVFELVREAKLGIENLSPEQVEAEIKAGTATIVDLRDTPELAAGCIPGSVHASRGMLEFYADPNCPFHKKELDPARRTIVYCAGGGRSALAVHTLQAMGYRSVAHLEGGFHAWEMAGKPVRGG